MLRPVYPHSLIPGGVDDIGELRARIASDESLEEHYGDFNLSRIRWVKLKSDEWAYVSYRMPSGIYWTTKRAHLKRGELVLTDGIHTARARCGNRISEFPQGPTLFRGPEPQELDVIGELVSPSFDPMPPPYQLDPSPPPWAPPLVPIFPPPPGGGPPFFPLPPPQVSAGGSISSVPLSVLLMGLLGTWLVRRMLGEMAERDAGPARRANSNAAASVA